MHAVLRGCLIFLRLRRVVPAAGEEDHNPAARRRRGEGWSPPRSLARYFTDPMVKPATKRSRKKV
jgi:hypothetical protein